MTTMTLNDFLPQESQITKIHTGSELLFAFELNKYVKSMFGAELDLSDLEIEPALLEGAQFSFVATNGLKTGVDFDRQELLNISKQLKYFYMGDVSGIKFEKETPEEVVYRSDFDYEANRKLRGEFRSMAYVSILAYVVAKAKLEGREIPKLLINHSKHNQVELEYVDLYVLKNYGNRLFDELVEVQYSKAWGFQPEWEAFVIYNRQLGEMLNEYSIKDKHTHLKENFEVGDVVLMYERTKGSQGKTINQLKNCSPAVITYFDEGQITLKYYSTVQTTLTRHMEIQGVSDEIEEFGKEPIYTAEDFDLFNSWEESFSLTSIGVDKKTFAEQTFFIKPVDFDGTYQYFQDGDRMVHIHLSTLDTIYAVFEDRNVEYNREKFLDEYFRKDARKPVYDNYVS